MKRSDLRAWWFQRQGLDGSLSELDPSQILKRTGWTRSVGGANPYLALFARSKCSRVQVDAALANLEVHELPSARGCTYLVPKDDYALALRVAQGFGDESAIRVAMNHLKVISEEIDRLGDNIVSALKTGPLDPAELRKVLGDKVRTFGVEGKKRGVTTDLPLALGRLQTHGHVRRIPVNGRVDNQRYMYALWNPNPLKGYVLERDEAMAQLAASYFSWIGLATLKNFQWFSGLSMKAAQAATSELNLVPVEEGSELVGQSTDVDSFRSFKRPTLPIIVLTGGIDNITHLRAGIRDLIEDSDTFTVVPVEKGVLDLGGVSELTSHAIYDRGRLIGVWEFDPESQSIAWKTWVERTDDLLCAVKSMEHFVRTDLGDARTFSLDSPQSRKPRLEVLRAG